MPLVHTQNYQYFISSRCMVFAAVFFTSSSSLRVLTKINFNHTTLFPSDMRKCSQCHVVIILKKRLIVPFLNCRWLVWAPRLCAMATNTLAFTPCKRLQEYVKHFLSDLWLQSTSKISSYYSKMSAKRAIIRER